MKKLYTLAVSAVLAGALLLTGCGSDQGSKSAGDASKPVTIKVGATPVPHAEILNQIKPLLKKEGVNLEVVEFNDYVQPNAALADKEIDANYFQHKPYLDKFNKDRGTHLVAVEKIHVEPMGVYSHSVKDIKNLPNGAKIAIPNDPSNAGRALLLLQKAGVITLKDGGTVTSTVLDVTANPKNVQFVEIDAAQLPRSLDDVTAAVINTNYALQAGLNPSKDALFIEDADSPYSNVLVIREGEENNPAIKKLEKALQSEAVKNFIKEKYKGSIVATF